MFEILDKDRKILGVVERVYDEFPKREDVDEFREEFHAEYPDLRSSEITVHFRKNNRFQ